VTVGALTYFSSRWLSPRLTRFFEANPGISLRIEPLNSVDMMRSVKVDMAILWGIGGWEGHKSELLLPLPAVPTANRAVAEQVMRLGLGAAAAKADFVPRYVSSIESRFRGCSEWLVRRAAPQRCHHRANGSFGPFTAWRDSNY
jgi:DNA-binding transcriptional LysR family regulator